MTAFDSRNGLDSRSTAVAERLRSGTRTVVRIRVCRPRPIRTRAWLPSLGSEHDNHTLRLLHRAPVVVLIAFVRGLHRTIPSCISCLKVLRDSFSCPPPPPFSSPPIHLRSLLSQIMRQSVNLTSTSKRASSQATHAFQDVPFRARARTPHKIRNEIRYVSTDTTAMAT